MSTSSSTAAGPSDPRRASLVRFAVGNLLGLLVEASLGIGLTLYVTLPSQPSYTQVFVSIPLLTAHIVLGFLLVIAAAGLLVLGRRASISGLSWRTGLVFLFVVVALQEGFSYTFTGNNAFSMGMAASFVLALVLEVMVVAHLRRSAPRPPGTPSPP